MAPLSLVSLGPGHLTPSAHAAVVDERQEIEIFADHVIEQRRLVVEIEDADDVEAWRRVPVLVDEHRHLEVAEGVVVLPDGARDRIGRRDRDESQVTAAGMLHLSQRVIWLEADELVTGARLEIDLEIVDRPYYPSDVLPLGLEDDDVTLEVTVRAAPEIENWRWRLDGDPTGLEVEATEQVVTVRGRLDGTGADEPALAVSRKPRLRWAWRRGAAWSQVARWYGGVIHGLPRDDAAVRALAGSLTTADAAPRQRLDDLVAFVRDQVRYVAVEVGIGGYRPSPPHETLERRWGDCKDKSFLLLDLLRAVGIDALPVLARLDDARPVDPSWPDALQFNHLIVAVPVDGPVPVETTPNDPVAGGFLFVDPTQTLGGADYLHTLLHGSHGLIVRGDGGELVRLPVQPQLDARRLEIELTVDTDGQATGDAAIHLRGDAAVPWLLRARNAPRAEVDDAVRGLLQSELPGYRLGAVAWRAHDPADSSDSGLVSSTGAEPTATPETHGVPTAILQARIDGTVGGGTWNLPTGLRLTPTTRELDEVIALGDEAMATWSPRSVDTVVKLHMPPGSCPPRPRDDASEGAAGRWRQEVSSHDAADGPVVTVRRGGVITSPWHAGDRLADLRAMSIEEQRAQRRRLRAVCP
ncbi:MAG: transglutaminase-like domain-containing protein [Acidobacteriota bacterium]